MCVEIERDVDCTVKTCSESYVIFCIYRPLYIHFISKKECLSILKSVQNIVVHCRNLASMWRIFCVHMRVSVIYKHFNYAVYGNLSLLF